LISVVLLSCSSNAGAQKLRGHAKTKVRLWAGTFVVVTNASPSIGNGSDITNVTLGGVTATRMGQGTNWVAFISPASESAGVKNIVIESTSVGETTLVGAYTVNPAGQIGGGVVEDWTQWQEVAGLPAAYSGMAVGVMNGGVVRHPRTMNPPMSTGTNGTNWTEVAGMPPSSTSGRWRGCAKWGVVPHSVAEGSQGIAVDDVLSVRRGELDGGCGGLRRQAREYGGRCSKRRVVLRWWR